jgi:hypothetical protein
VLSFHRERPCHFRDGPLRHPTVTATTAAKPLDTQLLFRHNDRMIQQTDEPQEPHYPAHAQGLPAAPNEPVNIAVLAIRFVENVKVSIPSPRSVIFSSILVLSYVLTDGNSPRPGSESKHARPTSSSRRSLDSNMERSRRGRRCRSFPIHSAAITISSTI